MTSWQDSVTLIVEWGTRGEDSSADAAWDSSLWDSSTRFWAGAEPEWVELSDCELSRLTIQRGRSFATEAFAVGTASLVLVLSEAESGEEVPGDRWSWRSAMTIGDELRVRAVHQETGTTWPLFQGDIRTLTDGWNPYGVHQLTVSMAEIAGRLGRVNPLAQELTGAGDHTGARMHRVADLALIPDTRRAFDTGTMTLQATNFARNLAGEAEVTAASEGGDLFTSRDGLLTFRQRAWWQIDPRASAVRHIWANTDVTDPEAPVACPVFPETRLSIDLVQNVVALARAGGSQQVATDTASRSLHGPISYSRSDLMNTNDGDVASLAAWRVSETGNRTKIIDGLNVNPVAEPDAWESGVLDLELGDLQRLVWDDGESVTDLLVHIQGIAHTVTPQSWETSLLVWDRYGYTPQSAWDIGEWDVALWGAA